MQVTDARNIVQNNTYDALDRRISTTYPGSASENVALTYDEAGHGFGVGRLTSMIDEAGTLSRSYDERGNVISETRIHGAAGLVTAYTYDAMSRIASIKYPSGATAAYARDAMGRVTGVTMKPSGAGSAISVLSSIAYQPFGPVSGLTFGNGVNGTRSFDLDYRLTNLADSSVQNLTYGYNAANDVLSITDGMNSASSQSFGYDALDRLTSASGVYGSLGWTYDSNGNRLTQTTGGTTTNYVYTAQSNRLTQVKTGSATQVLSYTPAGSITTIANVPSTRRPLASPTTRPDGSSASLQAGRRPSATITTPSVIGSSRPATRLPYINTTSPAICSKKRTAPAWRSRITSILATSPSRPLRRAVLRSHSSTPTGLGRRRRPLTAVRASSGRRTTYPSAS